jgi:hypothetical protein
MNSDFGIVPTDATVSDQFGLFNIKFEPRIQLSINLKRSNAKKFEEIFEQLLKFKALMDQMRIEDFNTFVKEVIHSNKCSKETNFRILNLIRLKVRKTTHLED